jgi:PKD repeat protein
LAQPANDACGGATSINPNNGCLAGTTVASNDSWIGSLGCQGGGQNPDVWYTFTATNTQLDYNVTTAAPWAGNVEFILVEATGPCTGLTVREANCGPSVLSGSVTGIQVGVTYYITISTPSTGTPGPFTLCINNVAAPVSPGQDCTNAAILCNSNSLTQGTFTGIGAAENIALNTCFGSNERQSKWYKFTVGCSGTLGFDIIPTVSTNDYDFALWNTTAGCYATGSTMGTALACNWSGTTGPTGLSSTGNVGLVTPNPCTLVGAADCATGGGPNSGCQPCTYQTTVVNVVAGQTYTLLVDNFGASGSGFTMNFNGTATLGPDAAFTFTNPSCGVFNFTKTCQTTNSTFLWSFGDGNTSTAQNPSHTYVGTGTYTVVLEVTDALGCVTTSSVTIAVNFPVATATPNPATICSGETTNIVLTSTVIGTTYSWIATSNTNVGGESLTTQTTSTIANTLTNATASNEVVNYSVTPTAAGCTGPSINVAVTVAPLNTVTSPSSNPIVCINTAISPNITFTTTGATGIGAPTGLPAGVSASFAGNTITVSGTPTAAGTFNYSIPLTGGCGIVNATGTITVITQNTIAAGTNQTVCINSAITNIALATTGATGATFSGLPAGVTGSWAGNVATISGTPTASGTFNYTVTTTGGCPPAIATGTITVTPQNTIAEGTTHTLAI